MKRDLESGCTKPCRGRTYIIYWVKRKVPVPRIEEKSPGRPGFFRCPGRCRTVIRPVFGIGQAAVRVFAGHLLRCFHAGTGLEERTFRPAVTAMSQSGCLCGLGGRDKVGRTDSGDCLPDEEYADAALWAQVHHKASGSADCLPGLSLAMSPYRFRSEFRLQVREFAPVAWSEEAEVAYADEAFGKDVLGVSAHELDSGERHLPVRTLVAVVLVFEGDCVIVHGLDAVVADGDAVGVSCDVLKGLVHTADG